MKKPERDWLSAELSKIITWVCGFLMCIFGILIILFNAPHLQIGYKIIDIALLVVGAIGCAINLVLIFVRAKKQKEYKIDLENESNKGESEDADI